MAYDTRSGEPPGQWHGNGADEVAAARAVRACKKDHPYASTVEIEQVRTEAGEIRAEPVPHFDLTVSAVKSVRVSHASYRAAAMQA